MSIEVDKSRRCKRVTKQGLPCRSRPLIGADYCFTHSVFQRHGWAFYVEVVGSIATVISLIIFFLPSPQVSLPPQVASSSSAPSISAFRVIKQTNNEVTLEADYIYDAAYGDRVFIGACLYRNGRKIGEIPQEYGEYCGYVPDKGGDPAGRVPSVGRGTARVVIRPPLKGPEMSDEVEIFLNRHGDDDTMIVSRRFPFIQNWTP